MKTKRWVRRISAAALGICAAGFLTPLCSYAGLDGVWELAEDGKHWQYVYGPGQPVTDEWIEADGNEYYLDEKGYMKTGWITDERDGERYFLGADGAKCKNMFLPDGKYVGPDGIVLTSFGTWQKAVKKELEKQLRAKTGGVFSLTDINGDGYPDLVVLDNGETPSRVFLAAVWEEDSETLQTVAESSADEPVRSCLTKSPERGSIWLITEQDHDWEKNYFELESDGDYFEHRYRFTTDKNDWGDLVCYVNGDEVDETELAKAAEEARVLSGEQTGYFPITVPGTVLYSLDHDAIQTALKQGPDENELRLWQS